MIKFISDIFKDKKGRLLPCIKAIERVGRLTLIRLRGDIDFDTVRELSNNVNDEMRGNFNRNIALDFKEVTNVDSSTLAYMISLLNKLQKKGNKLGVINASSQLDSYLTIARLGLIIHKYRNEEEALEGMT